MINNKFEVYKIKREIKRSGTTLSFYRKLKNEFGEPLEEYDKLKDIKGLYYEHSAHYLDTYLFMQGIEPGRFRMRKTPQLLCMYEEQFIQNITDGGENKCDILQIGDFAYINRHYVKVNGIFNIQEWNKLITISFEEVDYGSQGNFPSGKR